LTHGVGYGVGDLAPGDRVADFEVQEQVGRGGMAVVYRALDLRLGRLVALKVLAPALGEDEAFRVRFMRESRAAAGVEHPHIIPVFDAGEVEGLLFIAMRYVGRGDVRKLLDAERTLTTDRAISITAQVASALDAAHAHGLVHRDVKPGNMLLAEADRRGDYVYLADFGLSKTSLAQSTLTAAGQFLGTLDYVAPEQIQGQPVDGRADQYALACTVAEMLVGSPPFRHDETMALMWAQLEAPPPRLTLHRPDLPPALDAVIATALSKSPGGRFATCGEFAAALSAACRPRPPQAQRTQSAPARWTQSAPARWTESATARWTESATAELPPHRAAAPRADQDNARHLPATAAGDAPDLARDARPRHQQDAPRAQRARNRPGPDAAGRPAGSHRSPGPATAPQRPRPRQTHLAALLIAIVLVAGLAAVGYRLLAHHAPATGSPSSGNTVTAGPRASADATVRAYFAAINRHDFKAAWKLNSDTSGETFSQFKRGFNGTAHDTLTILGTTNNGVVTARLTATQTDGAVKLYRGTYTVTDGVIVSTDVQRVR
jgi:Protein kinase domain